MIAFLRTLVCLVFLAEISCLSAKKAQNQGFENFAIVATPEDIENLIYTCDHGKFGELFTLTFTGEALQPLFWHGHENEGKERLENHHFVWIHVNSTTLNYGLSRMVYAHESPAFRGGWCNMNDSKDYYFENVTKFAGIRKFLVEIVNFHFLKDLEVTKETYKTTKQQYLYFDKIILTTQTRKATFQYNKEKCLKFERTPKSSKTDKMMNANFPFCIDETIEVDIPDDISKEFSGLYVREVTSIVRGILEIPLYLTPNLKIQVEIPVSILKKELNSSSIQLIYHTRDIDNRQDEICINWGVSLFMLILFVVLLLLGLVFCLLYFRLKYSWGTMCNRQSTVSYHHPYHPHHLQGPEAQPLSG